MPKKILLFTTISTGIYYNYTQVSKNNFIKLEENYKLIEINTEELYEGQMKEIKVGDNEDDVICIAKVDGVVYAFGSKCSHFGAPLAKGLLFGDRVYCPFHLASFSIKDGAPDNGPVFKGIPVFEIIKKDGKTFVKVTKDFKDYKNIKTIKRDLSNKEKIVIVGGGPSALSAAETLRHSGFTGTIEIYSDEDYLTYDRTILTKNILNANINGLQVRKEDYLSELGIDFKLKSKVKKVNSKEKEIILESGEKVNYSKILIATGASPLIPSNLKTENINGIYNLYNYNDILNIRNNKTKNIVVIGGGFIGVESASCLKLSLKDDTNVTIVSDSKVYNKLGDSVSKAVSKLITDNNVNLEQSGVSKLEEDKSTGIKKVYLTNGKVLEADFIILGKGITPNSNIVDNIEKNNEGYIKVDSMFRSLSDKNIFSCGDVCEVPYFYSDSVINCKHYADSITQGAYAAWNMLNKFVPFDNIPFFWSRMFNKSLCAVGDLSKFTEEVTIGDVENHNFLTFYIKNNLVSGVVGMGKSHDLITINQAMKLGIKLNISDIKKGNFNIDDLRKEVLSRGSACNCTRTINNKL